MANERGVKLFVRIWLFLKHFY